MKKNVYRLCICIGLSVLFFSCDKSEKKESPVIAISDAPAIQLNAISPKSVKQFDEVEFTIAYTDGDGDLGEENPDEKSLEITDERAGLVHAFHIPPVAPLESSISVSGIFTVALEHVILMDPDNDTEPVTFLIRIKDRSGNWSNTIQSEVITVRK
jgi:hypothetical protein